MTCSLFMRTLCPHNFQFSCRDYHCRSSSGCSFQVRWRFEVACFLAVGFRAPAVGFAPVDALPRFACDGELLHPPCLASAVSCEGFAPTSSFPPCAQPGNRHRCTTARLRPPQGRSHETLRGLRNCPSDGLRPSPRCRAHPPPPPPPPQPPPQPPPLSPSPSTSPTRTLLPATPNPRFAQLFTTLLSDAASPRRGPRLARSRWRRPACARSRPCAPVPRAVLRARRSASWSLPWSP